MMNDMWISNRGNKGLKWGKLWECNRMKCGTVMKKRERLPNREKRGGKVLIDLK